MKVNSKPYLLFLRVGVSSPDTCFDVSQIMDFFLAMKFSSFLLAAFVTIDHFQISEACFSSSLE